MGKRVNRFSKAAQESSFARLIDPVIMETKNLLDALEFIEGQVLSYSNNFLYPMQRLCVRCLFGVPFDKHVEIPGWGEFPIWDDFRENKLYTFRTEAEALKYLYEQGQTNVADWRDIPGMGEIGGGFKEAAIFAGRRGGKSQLVSGIGSYSLYRLLSINSPKDYYDLISPIIDFTFLAQDDEGSSRLYEKLREDVNKAPFFQPYLKGNGATEMSFITESDRFKPTVTPTIRAASFPCSTNAARGPSSILLALDEFAHFRAAKGSSSEEVYAAATPATLQFTPKEGSRKGLRDAMVVSISSPWKRVGKMYEIHKKAMEKGMKSGIFTLRVSTAEMNPRADAAYLRQQFELSPVTWKAEYGGKFLDSSESYVKESQLRICVDVEYDAQGEAKAETGRKNSIMFAQENIGRMYFWGLDLGMKHDGTALAIGHLESRNFGIELVYDYIDRMMVGEEFDGPGVTAQFGDRKYIGYQELPLEDIVSWLVAMNNIMPCYKGVTDQHGGSMLVQLLQINGIQAMELVHLTPAINSQMFFALKGYIDHKRCRFPYVPKFLNEIRNVEADLVSKYVLKVQAPLEKGAHDDMVDAAGLVAWQAQKYLEEDGKLLLDPTGQSFKMMERMGKAPAPIQNLDDVSMRELQVLERQNRIMHHASNVQVVRNPWHVRGNARGRR